MGDGAVGLCAVLAAARLGAERIIALSRNPVRQALAVELHRHHRGMGHLPAVRVGGLPEGGAGLGVAREQQRGLAARGQDHRAVVDQRALPGIPRRHSRAVLADQVQSPAQFASDRVQADDVALGAHRHEQLLGERRNSAGHPVIALDRDEIGITPDLPPVGQRQATQGVLLLVAVVIHEIDAPVEDCGTGVAFPHVSRPQLAGLASLPGARKADRFRADAVTVGAPKLRPSTRQVRRLALGTDQLAAEDRIGTAARFPARGLVSSRDAQHQRLAGPAP